jgi:hypothetical protein
MIELLWTLVFTASVIVTFGIVYWIIYDHYTFDKSPEERILDENYQ